MAAAYTDELHLEGHPDDSGDSLPELSVVFGDGAHPSTALIRSALADELEGRPGASVLDAGCGTGVLSATALGAGAGTVVAVDRDARAVFATRRRCPEAEVLHAELSSALVTVGTFDIVAANIAEPDLSASIAALAAAVAPGGTLLLCGIQLWQAHRLEQSLWAAGLVASDPVADRGWCLYRCQKRA